ncbi:hypothetical protein [Halopiger xanaduensis]|uniref:hypothetical protein n=1 Tax=Halopiger xanaduensis TaxID=387343 RepID=UPI000AB161C1|nr:hypothetical protein [Halopiger xanaduensis]
MDRVEYVYTIGITDEEVEDRLERVDSGVLVLAADGDAYAVPAAHHYDADSL